LNTLAFCEGFQSGETLRADGVFHFAGVRFRNAFLDSEADQKFPDRPVALDRFISE
jgi:hypothetical protein